MADLETQDPSSSSTLDHNTQPPDDSVDQTLDQDIDMAIDINPDSSSSQNPAPPIEPAIPPPRDPTRKDISLRDFLAKMDDYAPIVRAWEPPHPPSHIPPPPYASLGFIDSRPRIRIFIC